MKTRVACLIRGENDEDKHRLTSTPNSPGCLVFAAGLLANTSWPADRRRMPAVQAGAGTERAGFHRSSPATAPQLVRRQCRSERVLTILCFLCSLFQPRLCWSSFAWIITEKWLNSSENSIFIIPVNSLSLKCWVISSVKTDDLFGSEGLYNLDTHILHFNVLKTWSWPTLCIKWSRKSKLRERSPTG